MNMKHLIAATVATLAASVATIAVAAPDTYMIEPGHTYPSFEADHMGISILRGKFTKSSGTVVIDRAAKTGSLDIAIDASTLDFGNDKLNEHASGPDMFDVAKFPTATYKSKSITFNGDVPTTVNGELTLHGVTKPVVLTHQQVQVHPAPDAQARSVRRRCLGHLQPRRLRHRLRRQDGLQSGSQTGDPGRSRQAVIFRQKAKSPASFRTRGFFTLRRGN